MKIDEKQLKRIKEAFIEFDLSDDEAETVCRIVGLSSRLYKGRSHNRDVPNDVVDLFINSIKNSIGIVFSLAKIKR